MRILLVLIVLAGLCFGGFYTYWHKQADVAKTQFVHFIESMNAGAKPFTKDLELLHYDSISVTGFPSAMVVEINKPVFNAPISGMIQTSKPAGTAAALPYDWVEEYHYGDKLTFTGNMTGTHFTLTQYGDSLHKALVNNAPRHTLAGSSSTPFVCNFDFKKANGNGLWTLPFNDAKSFSDNFRSFDCSVRGLVSKDAASGNTLSNMDEFSLSASNEPTGHGSDRKVSFVFNQEKFKAEPAFDAVVYDYLVMFYTLLGKADELGSSFPLSEYGEQNAKLDIHYDGPADMSDWAAQDMNMHFDINHFDFNSTISNMLFELHVASAPQGANRELTFAMHSNADISERGDQISKKRFTDLLTSMAKKPATAEVSRDPGMEFFQKLSKLGSPADVVEKLYPNMHALGKMAFNVDFNVKGPNQGQKFLMQGSATLDDFDILTSLYGVKSKGSASASTPGKPPAGDLTLTCLACDTLVTDIGNYAMRVESVVDKTMDPPKKPYLTTELIDGVKQFLHGIAENASASDLVIHFVSRDTGDFTVSGKQLPAILALFQTTIAPRLPQMSPAAGGSPEPTLPPGAPEQ